MDFESISTPHPKVAEGNSSLSVQNLGAEELGGSTRTDHENTVSTPHTQGKTSTQRPYKGIWRNKGKWVSEIRIPKMKEKIWLGSYESAEKAAQAYDEALNNMRLAELSGAKSADEIKRFVRGHASVGTSGVRAHKRSKLSSKAELVVPDSTCLTSMDAHKIVFEPVVETGVMEVKACLPDPNLATDTSEVEAYIPTFAPEEPPEIPLADLPFDEEFIKGSDDWILDFMAERSDD